MAQFVSKTHLGVEFILNILSCSHFQLCLSNTIFVASKFILIGLLSRIQNFFEKFQKSGYKAIKVRKKR